MFGFLKKKLQEAVSKFSGKAKESIAEERVIDPAALAEARREEERLLAAEKVVEVIPETPAQRTQHEEREKRQEAKKPAKQPVKEGEKREEKKSANRTPPEEAKTPVRETVSVPSERPALKKEGATEPMRRSATIEQPVARRDTPTTPPLKKEAKTERKPGLDQPVLREEKEPVEREEKRAIRDDADSPRAAPRSFFGLFKKKDPVKTPEMKRRPERAPSPREESPVDLVSTPQPPTPRAPETGEGESVVKKIQEERILEKPARGLLSKLKETFTKKTLSEERFEELFWDLEVALLENNVAVEVIEKLKTDLKRALTSGKISRLGVEDLIMVSLKESVREVLDIAGFDLVSRIKESKKRPFVITFIGVNGSGKTTTLAKVANLFQEEGLSVVIAASDTFRAAAIDQLKEHADNLGIKLISQGYGADPAAVAYDAVEHARARGIDVVMIDTAGRLHSNTNLMAELQKVVKVAKPDLKIFIGESITGNDCVEQAKEFDRLAGIDAIILSKADVDEKGGAALSVSYVTKKPILYLGVGQAYGDLKRFDKEQVITTLGL